MLIAVVTGFVASNPDSGVKLESCSFRSAPGGLMYSVAAKITKPEIANVQLHVYNIGGLESNPPRDLSLDNRGAGERKWTKLVRTSDGRNWEMGLLWCGMSETRNSSGATIWSHPPSDHPIRWNEPT
jgi:hypothetical protein